MAVRCLTRYSHVIFVIISCDPFHLLVYPNVCSISLVAMGSKTEYDSRVCFWDDVYGEWEVAHGVVPRPCICHVRM